MENYYCGIMLLFIKIVTIKKGMIKIFKSIRFYEVKFRYRNSFNYL